MSKVFNIKKALPFDRKNVAYMLGMFAIIYVIMLYLLGIHFGFYVSIVKFSAETIGKYIFPISFYIIITEYIREKILFGDLKYKKTITFLIMLFLDVIVSWSRYDLGKASDFLTLFGYIICVSIANNMLFNYISIRYGKQPNIIYRLITTLYVYIIPITPNVHILIHTLIKLLFPYIIYMFVENTYSKSTTTEMRKNKKIGKLVNAVLIILMLIVTMLVTCKFKYGALVIGSGSMTGTINKGDMIIFEQYKGTNATNNQIIVFNKENKIIVHRVVEIKNINKEKRYYTKGDNNNERDDGYITDEQIIGIYKFKISQIGELTLLFNDLFER